MNQPTCACGCGQPVKNRWVHGHNNRSTQPPYAVDTSTGCWVWQKCKLERGYGLTSAPDRPHVRAHRLYWERANGPIPEGLQIDHLCCNPSCVNPDHMELVTSAINTLRGNSFSAQNARKTHCLRGHEFTPENTRVARGSRTCRMCARLRQAEYTKRLYRAWLQGDPKEERC